MPTTTAADIVGATRPECHEDLEDYQTNPHVVAKIDAPYLVRYPSLGLHLLAALNEAKTLGLRVSNDGEILLPRSDVELNAALRQAQSVWDGNRDRYLRAAADPASITEGYQRNWVNRFAEAENLPAIVWDAEVSA